MAIDWKFNADEVETLEFPLIPIGQHRVRISSAKEKVSKAGNNMIEIILDVSGYNGSLWYYIVLDESDSKKTNSKLAQFWESFGIQQGNFELASWINKVGAVLVKHDQYNGETKEKVSYPLSQKKQENLPPWKEPANKAAVTGATNSSANIDVAIDDDELPF